MQPGMPRVAAGLEYVVPFVVRGPPWLLPTKAMDSFSPIRKSPVLLLFSWSISCAYEGDGAYTFASVVCLAKTVHENTIPGPDHWICAGNSRH